MPGITDKDTAQIDGVGAFAPTPVNRANAQTPVSKLVWFVALYCAGLLVTAAVVYFFRTLLGLN